MGRGRGTGARPDAGARARGAVGALLTTASQLSPLTGDAELDALISKYADGETETTQGGHTMAVRALADGSLASGQCGASARHFAAHITAHDVEAYADRWDEHKGPPSQAFGYDDRPHEDEGSRGRHYFTVVVCAGQTYTVDWTAAQFGYSEFPLVQRQRADGGWERPLGDGQWH